MRFSKILIQLNIWVISIILLFSNPLKAQHSTSSPYSRFGIGDISPRGNSQTFGMGNVSAAIRSDYSLNFSNPASYSALAQNTFLLDLSLNYKSSIFEIENASQYNNDANINHFAFAFAANNWLFFSAGISPISTIGYDVNNTYTLADSTQAVVSYTGQGGLSKVFLGTTVLLYKRISLGLNMNYVFGTIEKEKSTYLLTEGGSTLINDKERNVYKKFVPEFGLQYSDTINSKFNFTLGLVYNPKTQYNTYTEWLTQQYLSINGNAFEDTINNEESPNSLIDIPMSIGAGFAFKYKNKILFAADYYYQDWTKSNIESVESFSLTKEYNISAGLEFIPKLGGNKLRENIRYRIGGYYKNSYLQSGNNNINLSGVTFGIGLPFKGSSNILNASFEYGKRGTIENNLLQEKYLLFSFSLSLHDYWFRKFKFN